MKPFNYFESNDLDGVAKLLKDSKEEKISYIAGGTNLVDLLKKQINESDVIVDVGYFLPNNIKETKTGIQIGALAKNSYVANHPLILSKFPIISKTILAGASPQIRNMATMGGNILQRTRCPYFYDKTALCNKRENGQGCSALQGVQKMSAIIGYSDQCIAVHPSDLCIALAVLQAKINYLDLNVRITHEDDRDLVGIPFLKPPARAGYDYLLNPIDFKNFHRLPGNDPTLDNNLPKNTIIHSIDLEYNLFNKNYYLKIRDRASYSFAIISVAVCMQLENNRIKDIRIASGGVSHKPWRWYEAENFLLDKEANISNFDKASTMVIETVKTLPNNHFKRSLLKGAVQFALQKSVSTI